MWADGNPRPHRWVSCTFTDGAGKVHLYLVSENGRAVARGNRVYENRERAETGMRRICRWRPETSIGEEEGRYVVYGGSSRDQPGGEWLISEPIESREYAEKIAEQLLEHLRSTRT